MMEVRSQKPLVSVVMPAYNAEKYIADAIRSVLRQTLTDLELIVIDDGSVDKTAQIVREMAGIDERIRFCPNEKNMGTARSRNRGMDLSRGEYVAFLDSDDNWHPRKLEKQMQMMENTRAELVYCSYAIVDGDGAKRCRDFLVPETIDLDGLLKENVIGCSTVLLNRSTAESCRFRDDFYHEDYVLWLQMLQSGCRMAGVREVLVDYRYHPDSRAGNKLASAQRRWKIYREYLNMPFVESVKYLRYYAMAGLKKYKKC